MPIDWVWAVLKIFAQKIEDLQKSDFVVWLICGMFGMVSVLTLKTKRGKAKSYPLK